MKNSNLVKLLCKLDQTSLNRIGEMVVSPYFNKDKKVTLLFELLKPFAPDFESPKLTRQLIFEQLYPGKKKITGSLSVIMSKLQGLINEHLIAKQLEARPFYKRHLLMKSLLEAGEGGIFKKQYKETARLMENQSKRDIESYCEKYLIEQDYRRYLNQKKGRNDRKHLPIVIRELDGFYLSRKLNLTCELLSVKGLINLDDDNAIIEVKEKAITKPSFIENSFIQLYYAVMRILRDRNDEKGFQHLVTLLNQPISGGVKKAELNEIYTHALNFCIEKIIKGKGEYREILLDLYLLLIDNKLLYIGAYLDLGRFKNIISVACQSNKMTFARELVIKMKSEINPDYQESAFHYFMAVISFYEGDYSATIGHLSQVEEFIDVFFNIDSRTFMLRCYYELDEWDVFESSCKSFRKYLKRCETVNEDLKMAYSNFRKLSCSLFRYRDGFSKDSLISIEEKIENTHPLSHKNWLLEKLLELKNSGGQRGN